MGCSFLYWDNSKSSLFQHQTAIERKSICFKAVSLYSLKFKRQRKLKYKKNIGKSFHRNIHEFPVSRPQETEKYGPLITSAKDFNRNSYWSCFCEIQWISRSIRPDVFLEKRKKFAKSTGVKHWCWSLFFIKLQVEDQ